MTDPQTLNAAEATVLRAIQSYFERNPYETKIQFVELIVDLDGRLVAGKVKPIVEHLIHLGCLWGSTKNTLELTARGLSSLEALKLHSEDSFSHFCDLLVVALANHAERQVTKFDAFDLRAIAELYTLEFKAGWVERASEVFEKRAWARIKRFSELEEGGIISAALTGPGLLEAERLRKELLERGIIPPTYPPLDDMKRLNKSLTQPDSSTLSVAGIKDELGSPDVMGFVPASDRIVRLDDNAPGRLEAIENLDKIEKLLESGSNELKLTADERIVIVSEIKPLRERLLKNYVRVGEIYNAVTKGSPLVWLLDKVGGTAVGVAATAAFTALYLLAKALIG